MIGTITLNPSIDQLITVKNLVKDDANRALSVSHYPGGKGVNVSKVVRELGGKTRAHVILSGFTGNYWKHLVNKLDIPFRAVMAADGETRINTVFTDLKDKTQTRVSAPGPHVPDKILRLFIRQLAQSRPRPAYWALGGSLGHGMKRDVYARLVRCLEAAGMPCVLDTDNEALKIGVDAKPFMIKPNEYEMQRLIGRALKKVEDYADAAEALVRRGIRIVVVSLAERGALFVTKKEVFHAKGIDVPVKSKVGAGDSLIGGFLLGLRRGAPLQEAARIGIAASASAVMREAPRLCRHGDIRALKRKVIIKPL